MSDEQKPTTPEVPQTRVDRLAKIICDTGNVAGFRCTCPHPIDGWCNGEQARFKAKAAIAFMDNERADEIRQLEEDCEHWAKDYAELAKLSESRRVFALGEIAAREKAEAQIKQNEEERQRLAGYLRAGETVVQMIEREIRDCRQLMKLYGEEKARREIAEKLIDERAASHIKTTEEWEDEIEHYRRMFSRIASDEVPRVRVHKWREDGATSKEDRCAHTKAMWEDCSECVAEFASMVLRGAPATRVERDGVWYVPLGPAAKDHDGHSYSLDQLKPDEILVSPGWIYKREVPLVDMGGQLP